MISISSISTKYDQNTINSFNLLFANDARHFIITPLQTSKRTAAMTEELKTVVTIISVLIIVGIFGHGLWSIRKNKEQLRDLKHPKRNEPGLDVKGLDAKGLDAKASDEKSLEEHRDPLDADGLDSHGVGIPRTIGGSANVSNEKDNSSDSMPSFTAEGPLSVDDNQSANLPASQASNKAPAAQNEQASTSVTEKPISNKAKTEQTTEQATESQAEPSEVLIVHVSMPDGQTISGASLLPLLISLGFKFGEMDIFHRHEDSAGHGSVLFSLASMYNPGTFDIDNIEQISTKGLSMFMTLPCKGEALTNFNMMHNAAKKISEEFGAQLLDSNRSALTVQTVRHYVEKIREFERKRLIKG